MEAVGMAMPTRGRWASAAMVRGATVLMSCLDAVKSSISLPTLVVNEDEKDFDEHVDVGFEREGEEPWPIWSFLEVVGSSCDAGHLVELFDARRVDHVFFVRLVIG
jgi:hypothetical protein